MHAFTDQFMNEFQTTEEMQVDQGKEQTYSHGRRHKTGMAYILLLLLLLLLLVVVVVYFCM
jgi:hypothetical protein